MLHSRYGHNLEAWCCSWKQSPPDWSSLMQRKVLEPKCFVHGGSAVIACRIVDCIDNAPSGASVSIVRGGLGFAVFIECSSKCHDHAVHNSIELLLTNVTVEELRHLAQ